MIWTRIAHWLNTDDNALALCMVVMLPLGLVGFIAALASLLQG